MEQKDYRLSAVMYTDIKGFSRMMEKSEVQTLKLVEKHNAIIREEVAAHNGTVIKTIGDAFLVDFKTTLDAVNCAVKVQDRIKTLNDSKEFEPLLIRIGIHLGDIYFYEDDALGEGINIASRLQTLALPGGICLSQDVYNHISNKIPYDIREMGRVELKNISKNIHAYSIETDCSRIYGDSESFDSSTSFHKKQSGFSSEPVTAEDRMKKAEEIIAAKRMERKQDQKSSSIEDEDDIAFAIRRRVGRKFNHFMDRHGSSINEFAEEAPKKISRFLSEIMNKKEPANPDAISSAYPSYREKRITDGKGALPGFLGHAVVYGISTNFMMNINQGGFPWAAIASLGWGSGLLGHLGSAYSDTLSSMEVKKHEELTVRDYQTLRKFHKERKKFWSNISSLLIIPMLWLINTATWGGFMWWIIPSIFIGIGFLSSIPKYIKERLRFRKLFKKNKAAATVVSADKSENVRKAYKLRDSIKAQLQGFKKGEIPGGEDMEEVLDKYVLQIEELDKKNSDVESIIRQIPIKELQADMAHIERQRNKTDDQQLQREYTNSIEEMKHQQKAFDDLYNQKEILDLRLKSSLNNMKRLQIDLARMKNIHKDEDGLEESFMEQSQRLSQYTKDLKASYHEIDSLEQRFLDLEKQEEN